jgi:purine-binding chemotaxis protein CheW
MEGEPSKHQHQEHHSKEEHVSKGANLQLIVFKLAGEEYAMLIDQIKEVVLTPKIAKVPLTPKYIKGVANIRGNILAIIDLVERFSLETSIAAESQPTPMFTLVVESSEYKMGILVKDVPNTLSVYEADIDVSPSIINDNSGIDANYINGIVKSGSRMIVLIDVHKVINKDEIHRVIKEKSA